MSARISSPPCWRIVAAFILAPLITAFAFACIEPGYDGLSSLADRIIDSTYLYAFLGAYPATIVFGLPTFLVLRQRVRASAFNCAAAGAMVAPAPWLLLGLLFGPPYYAYDNGHVTAEHGVRTLWGWVELFEFAGRIAVLGALAGIVFWAIAAAGASRTEEPSS